MLHFAALLTTSLIAIRCRGVCFTLNSLKLDRKALF